MKVRDMARGGLFVALMAVCAWISVPTPDIAFTMQTFAVALCLCLLGGKRGTFCIGVYLLLGAVGAPVFSGFRGGAGVLLGATGGYVIGFFFFGLVYWLAGSRLPKAVALMLGMLVCYCVGTIWFYWVYLQNGSAIGVGAVLIKCVLPFLLPDAVKLGLAVMLAGRLKKFVY